MTAIDRHKLEPTRGVAPVHSPAGEPTRVTVLVSWSSSTISTSSTLSTLTPPPTPERTVIDLGADCHSTLSCEAQGQQEAAMHLLRTV